MSSYPKFTSHVAFPSIMENWANIVLQGVPGEATQAEAIVGATCNANHELTARTVQYVQGIIEEVATHFDGGIAHLLARIDNLTKQVDTLQLALQNQQVLVASYKQQVDALPASMGTGSARQPKIGEPPVFKGSDNKVKLREWLRLVALWCAHEGITTDKQRIVVALSKLQGPAHRYMEAYFIKVEKGEDLGS